MRIAILLAGLLAASPSLTLAATTAPAEEADEARRHFEQGAQLYAEGDLAGAKFEFERSYGLSGNYKILYNLAIVQLELHDYATAKGTFERYLAEGGDALDDERRQEVEKELAGLEGRVGQLMLTLTPPGATVSLDGAEVVVPEGGIDLNLGAHTVEATADGYAPSETRFEIEGGQQTEITLALERLDVPSPTAAKPERTTPADQGKLSERTRRLRLGTWIAVGATGVCGTAALVTGMLALGSESDLATERRRIPADRGALDDAQTRVQRLATTTDVLLGVGALAGLTAIGLGVAAWRSGKQDRSGNVRAGVGGLEVRF
ncbi:MAG: PEGA domain-containing protein [Myxococcota bacterium]